MNSAVPDLAEARFTYKHEHIYRLLKAAVLQNILKITSYKYFKISLLIYKIVVRNTKNPTYFHFYALKTKHALFCHQDIPTMHNGYCVSNAVDYA